MVYVEDWDAFAAQAEALFRSEPLKTRYCTKYIHKEGTLVLKVTDDKTVRKAPRWPMAPRWAPFAPQAPLERRR